MAYGAGNTVSGRSPGVSLWKSKFAQYNVGFLPGCGFKPMFHRLKRGGGFPGDLQLYLV